MDDEQRRRYELIGWWLFGLGVVFYLVQGIVAGELLGIAGSLAFLAGVVAFLLPMRRS